MSKDRFKWEEDDVEITTPGDPPGEWVLIDGKRVWKDKDGNTYPDGPPEE